MGMTRLSQGLSNLVASLTSYFVKKTGDTMSGNLTIQKAGGGYAILRNSSVTRGTTSNNGVTSDQYWGTHCRDTNGAEISFFRAVSYTSGMNMAQMAVQNVKTDGTVVSNALQLSMYKDGTRSVGVSDAAVWRSALGVNDAIKSITRSGTTFTATRVSGSTFTFTQQDNNTTYSAGQGLTLSGTQFKLNAWTQIKYWTGNGTQSYSMGSYQEYMLAARYGSSFLGTAVLPRALIDDTSREVYLGGGRNGTNNGRACAIKITTSTVVCVLFELDNTNYTTSIECWLFGR